MVSRHLHLHPAHLQNFAYVAAAQQSHAAAQQNPGQLYYYYFAHCHNVATIGPYG